MKNKAVPVSVVLMWHMHQPHYRDLQKKRFVLPWTYLHAIKDYSDMAWALEQNSAARAVVNFTPVLLRQLDEYRQELDAFLERGDPLHDSTLCALAAETLTGKEHESRALIEQCLRANRKRLIERFAPYRRMAEIADDALAGVTSLNWLGEGFMFDLLVWYHLAWMGESLRREDATVRRLMEKERDFDHRDRIALIEVIQREISAIIPRYRALAEAGRIELSFTPEEHPIIPLLLDFESARANGTCVDIPSMPYPGGEERSRWHIQRGLATFSEYFGLKPAGCWPAEGGVSDRTLELLVENDVHWVASGGGVLRNSMARSGHSFECTHHAFRVGELPLSCFFRDDDLSDMIGFQYQSWNEDDAVNNLVHHIENIRQHCEHDPDALVPIILDGENCWEYYAENGFCFLEKLYQRLAQHPHIELCTFSKWLQRERRHTTLPGLIAGSWVYGDFSTWIGHEDKNRAWELLLEAKACYDRVCAGGSLGEARIEAATCQLGICESSDWFWWFGDYNPPEAVRDFDRLFRSHLQSLYDLLGETAPGALEQSISAGGGSPELSGVMRRAQ